MADPLATAKMVGPAVMVARWLEMVELAVPVVPEVRVALAELAAPAVSAAMVASVASAAMVVLAATPPTASTEMVALAVLAVKQVRVVSAATELPERLALRVALAEPAELLEHRVAVEMAGLQEQAEPAAPAELVVRMVLQALPAMVVTAALAEPEH